MEENYRELLEALIEHDWLEGPALGIAKRALDKGTESLTEPQRKVLNTYALDRFNGLTYEDIPAIADMGYDGSNTNVLNCARDVKNQLGYIPTDNTDGMEGDYAFRLAMEEQHGL